MVHLTKKYRREYWATPMSNHSMYMSKKALIAELILLFILLPFVLTFSNIYINIPLIVIALVYVAAMSKKLWWLDSIKSLAMAIKPKASEPRKLKANELWRIFLMVFSFAVATGLYVKYVMPEQLFSVVTNNLPLWILICFVYVFLSVIPQEFLYRVFFFKRYKSLAMPSWIFVLLNASLFSLAHLMFANTLVMILTFCGGLLFAFTYHRTQSMRLITIEHSLYGLWLFTVGMGSMLAFPSA